MSGRRIKQQRHLFWRLLRTFWREQFAVFILIAIRIPAAFISPYAIEELLAYLELRDNGTYPGNDKRSSPILPAHTSILLLFLGPFISGFTFGLHAYIQTRFLVRCEAALTQLIFEHALRVKIGHADGLTLSSSGAGTTKNLISKINSLATNDQDNILGGRDFLFLCESSSIKWRR